MATRDWHGACDALQWHAANRSKEIQRVMRVHRDPFEPIMCILEADSPLAEYRNITAEILIRMPDEHRYPRPEPSRRPGGEIAGTCVALDGNRTTSA